MVNERLVSNETYPVRPDTVNPTNQAIWAN
jgi:hypothetical protein